jgi:7-carboxy-7-deazaguanine synthase
MPYHIKESFLTLQGEGFHTGRPAIFCRFTGCNLWSGRETDREQAVCNFCDTDFIGIDGDGGGSFETAEDLSSHLLQLWKHQKVLPFIVCTGGEPLLQLDDTLIHQLHKHEFIIAVETNGTIAAPGGLDWICMSPKANTQINQHSGNELKIVFPQEGLNPSDFLHLDFEHFLLQPMDGPGIISNTKQAIEYCLANPQWSLSIQTHKILGIS